MWERFRLSEAWGTRMTLFWTTLGASLLTLVLDDVYATILRATKRPGPISERLNRGMWWAALLPVSRLSGDRNLADAMDDELEERHAEATL